MKKALSVRRQSESNDPTLPTLLEFQWPSTVIVNAPVPLLARSIVWIIASMVLILIVITGMIPVDRVVTVKGIVVSQSPTILLQPLDTSIVRSIDVHEGQRVSAGQVLSHLDPTSATADVDQLKAELSSLDAEIARLQAEASNRQFNYVGPDQDRSLQAAISAHRRAEFNATVSNYARKHDELDSMIARSQSDASGYTERLKVAETARAHEPAAPRGKCRQRIEYSLRNRQSSRDGALLTERKADRGRRQA